MTKTRLLRTLLAISLLFCAAGVNAQESRATISGSVMDPSGAAIPKVNVVVTEVRTGVKTKTTTDAVGAYNIPFLPPGLYTISADASGFRPFERTGINLATGDHPMLDIKLHLGQASEVVIVTEDAPLVETANSSTGQSITTKQVEDMPLNGRNPMMIAQLAIGVVAIGNPTMVKPFDNAAASAWSIGGTPSQNAEILMDGAPNSTWDNRMAYAPPQDAVQEVKVKAFDADASYGHTQSGTINKVMKTGTNALHGSAYWFMQPSALAANDYFSNRAGIKPQDTKLSQWGGTAGGPVYLPKVFNGKNKLFWFFGVEKFSDSQPNAKFLTVPTAAERTGDFSSLLTVPGGADCITGANKTTATGYNCYQLFNPYSGTLSGSTVTRVPFYCDAAGNPIAPITTPGPTHGTQTVGTPCNKLPQSLLSPVALAYLKLYPQPNTAGDATGRSNYANSITTDDAYNNELGRLDWIMSDRSRLSGNVRHNVQFQSKNNYFANNSTGSQLTRENWGATMDEVYTLNNSTVLDVRANYTRMGEGHPSPSAGWDVAGLGLPSYMVTNSRYVQLPSIRFGSSCGSDTAQASGFDCFGTTGADLIPSSSYQLFGSVVKQWSNHTLKLGADGRKYLLDTQSYGNSTGSFSFNNSWTNGPTSKKSANSFGQDFAAFLLGLPTSGSYDVNTRATYSSYYYAFFVQDDWRIKRNLTINLGLRYDHDTPYSEKLGRTVNGFDSVSLNPISAAASAAYALNPISQIPASAFKVPGGLTFASASDRQIWQNDSNVLSPRVGFAWSPDVFHGTTVIRGGVGIFVQPLAMSSLNPVGKYSSSPVLTQEGFSQSTPVVTASSYVSPNTSTTGTLSDPFPGGVFLQAAGVNGGLATFDGQTISFFAPVEKNPYSERWTLGVQRAITPNLVMEVAYIGNHSVHLPIAYTQLNGIPRQYLSTVPYRDQAVIDALNASVTNPFKGLMPGTSSNGSTINVRQLLAPFPEFPYADSTTFSSGVLEQNNTIGSSTFNSLNVRVEKRMSHGLSVIGTYAWSKLMEQDSYLNATDTTLEKRISPFDRTQRFVAAVNYTLPIGRGKVVNLESRVLDMLVGGWQLNGIYSYQTGAPLLWMNGSTNNPGDYPLCAVATVNGSCPADANGVPQYATTMPMDIGFNNRDTNGASFDTGYFVTASGSQYQYHLRTLPTTLSRFRQDGTNNFDASILKNFSVSESKYFQFRMEGFNILNHPTFNAPNLQANNSSFGVINAMANRPRQLQIGLRFVF